MTLPLSQQCTAIKKNGNRCQQKALPDRETCVQHTPRNTMPTDAIELLKRRLLALTKSKNERTATRAALSLSQLMLKFPPKELKSKDIDLSAWTPEERAQLRLILDQMRDLRKQVAARLNPPAPVVEPASTEPPNAAAPVEPEPVDPPPVESPDDRIEVLGSQGPRFIRGADLADEDRV